MPLLPRPDLRSLLSFLAAGLAIQAAGERSAAAQVDLPGDIEMVLELPVGDPANPTFEARPDEEDRRFMNLANCTCGDDPAAEFQIEFSFSDPSADLPDETVEVWTGSACDQDQDNLENCADQETFELEDVEITEKTITVRELVAGSSGTCEEVEDKRGVYVIIDKDSDGDGDEEGDYSKSLAIDVDTRPPPLPSGINGVAGEGAIQVNWDPIESRTQDVESFQLLCARSDGSRNPADNFPRADRDYRTARDVCNEEDDPSSCPDPMGTQPDESDEPDAGRADAGESEADAGIAELGGADAGGSEDCPDLPGGLDFLDGAAVCAEQTSPATSIRADGLENFVPYDVVLVVVDPAGNPRAIHVGQFTPEPAEDFWEHYLGAGGGAKGGCSAAGAGIGGGLVLVVGLTFGLAFRRIRRRRKSATGAGGAAILLVLALSPGFASAQPWWEEAGEPVREQVGPEPPRWSFELKFGPYFPDIDSEFEAENRTPFEDVFGDGPFPMGLVTLDRFFLYPMGQLGVTATAGFMRWTTHALALDDGEPIPNENGGFVRSGDETGFRLIPMSVGVVYRFTQLDDQFRVPLVPYGRAGLSYYYWWITGPGGDIAEVDGNRAAGGSLGWQATAGLAVRAERLDPNAEMSLRNELGIEHAGLVFEFTYAKVDGFGADKKLRVGDATFFGGINFEF